MDRAFEFLQGGLARLRSSSSHFLLNLADLTQIDSSGVNIIVKTYHSLRGQSGDLRLLRPSGHALEVFRAPHLIQLRCTSTGKTRDLVWNGAILYFRGPFADRDGLRDLTAPVFKDMRVLRPAYAALGSQVLRH